MFNQVQFWFWSGFDSASKFSFLIQNWTLSSVNLWYCLFISFTFIFSLPLLHPQSLHNMLPELRLYSQNVHFLFIHYPLLYLIFLLLASCTSRKLSFYSFLFTKRELIWIFLFFYFYNFLSLLYECPNRLRIILLCHKI